MMLTPSSFTAVGIRTSLSRLTLRCSARPGTLSSGGRRCAVAAWWRTASAAPPSAAETAPSMDRSAFATVDHSDAYEETMRGRHGEQLSLAYKEGIGKDDAPWDPFKAFEEHGHSFDLEEEEAEGTDADGNEIVKEEDAIDDDGGDTADEEGIDVEDEIDDIDEELIHETMDQFTNDGSVRRLKSERATLRAGAPAGGLFAVVRLAGFQHKVTIDDLLVVNKLKPVDTWLVGSTHTLSSDDILLMGSTHRTLVGLPSVTGGEVDVMVEEIARDKTILVFKKRRRKHSRRKNGFRREVTFLRVLDIRMPEQFQDHEHR